MARFVWLIGMFLASAPLCAMDVRCQRATVKAALWKDTVPLAFRQIAWKAYGDRGLPPLILAHGFQAWQGYFEDVARALASRFRVVTYDQRGHGATVPAGRDYGSPVMAADLAELLEGLADQGEIAPGPVFLFGQSFGARTVMAFVDAFPDWVRAAALGDMDLRPNGAMAMSPAEVERIATLPTHYASRLEATVALVNWIDADTLQGDLVEEAPGGGIALRFHPSAWIFRGHAANREDFGEALRRVTVPMLALQAEPSLGARLTEPGVRHLRENAPGLRVQRIPGAFHGIHRSKPQAFVTALTEFFLP